MEIKSINPLKATIEFNFENKCIYISDEYGIVLYSIDLFKEYIEYFEELYEIYALEDDEKLSEKAIELKKKLLENVILEQGS